MPGVNKTTTAENSATLPLTGTEYLRGVQSGGNVKLQVQDILANGFQNPLTTKGDLLGFGTSAMRVPAGANGTSPVYDSTQASGIRADGPFVSSSDLADISTSSKGAGLIGFTYSLSYGAGTIGKWLKDLATSVGASFIGFLQAGTGAVSRTIQTVLREWPAVTDFGAVGDGVTFDTAAFTSAQAASSYVYLPANKTFLVGAGLNYWQFYGPGVVFENGQQWDSNPTPQDSKVLRAYRTRTFGNRENAVGVTFSINSADAQTRANTQVLGTTTQGMAQTYNDRDHVGMYGQSWTYEPDVTSASTTYTATTLTDTTVSTLAAAGKLTRGMIIDTKHATPLTGRIQFWAGNVITVDGWWTRGTGVAGTPANGTGAIINPNTKIWGQNTNIFVGGLASNNQAKKGTGYEIGLSCDPTIGVGVWGFDAVTLQGTPERHFSSRGSATYGYYAETGKAYGFTSKTNTRGFSSQDDTLPYEAVQGGTTVYTINSDGSTSSNTIKSIGVAPTQCTNAAFVNVGPLPSAYGGMFWISGFNTANGNEANFVMMVRSGLAAFVAQSDGSGLAIAFQATGRQLQIKCGNAGTFQFVAHGFVA